MATRTLRVRKNADGTFTISAERYREIIDIRLKSPYEKYETIRWAIVTAGFQFTPEVEKMVNRELYG